MFSGRPANGNPSRHFIIGKSYVRHKNALKEHLIASDHRTDSRGPTLKGSSKLLKLAGWLPLSNRIAQAERPRLLLHTNMLSHLPFPCFRQHVLKV